MAYRKIKAIQQTNHKYVMAYSNEWNEYRVRVYLNGVALEDSDYFTGCRFDAIDTLESMAAKTGELSYM